MLMASNRSNSMNDVVDFINTALRPLTISASYSTMSDDPDNVGQVARDGNRPVATYDSPPGGGNPPRNSMERDYRDRPPGNGDFQNSRSEEDDRYDDSRGRGGGDRSMEERDRPRQYANHERDRSRFLNSRGDSREDSRGDSRERDSSRERPRGVGRRNWEEPRSRNDNRRRPWNDQRYDIRRASYEDPRYGDRWRNRPRAADGGPAEPPWENSASQELEDQELDDQDSRNTPGTANKNADQNGWNGPGTRPDDGPNGWTNTGDVDKTRQGPWDDPRTGNGGNQGPRDDSIRNNADQGPRDDSIRNNDGQGYPEDSRRG